MEEITVTIWGPNLGTQAEQFHVHTPGCADTTKGIYRKADAPWNVSVTSAQDVVEDIFSDIIAENPDTTWEDYVMDVKFFPCVSFPQSHLDNEFQGVVHSQVAHDTQEEGPVPTTKKAAKTAKTSKKAPAKKAPAKKAAPTPKVCGCGCGGMTKGGTYIIGHDAKHKSALVKAVLSGTKAEAAKASKVLDERGWTKFVDKARETAERKARAATVKKATAKAGKA